MASPFPARRWATPPSSRSARRTCCWIASESQRRAETHHAARPGEACVVGRPRSRQISTSRTCDTNAVCTGGACRCNPGYVGDGVTCTGTRHAASEKKNDGHGALTMLPVCLPSRLSPSHDACSACSIPGTCRPNFSCPGGPTCGTTCNPGFVSNGTDCIRTLCICCERESKR